MTAPLTDEGGHPKDMGEAIDKAEHDMESLLDEISHEIYELRQDVVRAGILRDAQKQYIIELKDQIREMRGKG